MTVEELKELMIILVEEGKGDSNIFCRGEAININNLKIIDNVADIVPMGQLKRFETSPPQHSAPIPKFYK